MRKFTVITKDGSKWLRPVNPFDPRDIMWQEFNIKEPDLPYIGSRPEGTTVDEGEVMEVRQHRSVRSRKVEWLDLDISISSDKFETRTVYTDTKSHDLYVFDEILNNTSDDAKMNVSLQMDSNYWGRRCEAVERLIGISPSDPKTYDEFCRLREEWQQIVKQQPK